MAKTLWEAREVLTARNSVKLLKDGCKDKGTQVAKDSQYLTDATRRYLRTIKRDCANRMFAGNHNCRQMLVDGGYIKVVSRSGQWYQIEVTEKGMAA
jgi:hypothetical protein